MPGDVDEAEPDVLRKLEMSEAEIDGDAAALLFGQPVRVDSGESADQRGLAVVDVTGGAYDNISHVRVLKYFYIAPLLALLTGSLVYCAIAVVAAWRYRQSGAAPRWRICLRYQCSGPWPAPRITRKRTYAAYSRSLIRRSKYCFPCIGRTIPPSRWRTA